MKFCDESEISGAFNIGSLQTRFPALWPDFVWQGWHLKSHRGSVQLLDVSELTLGEVFKTWCPQPTLMEWRTLRSVVSSLDPTQSRNLWSTVNSAYGIPSAEYIQTLFLWIDCVPENFLNWATSRGLQWGHLRPLASLPLEKMKDREWLDSLGTLNVTLQRGQALIELCTELELMGSPPEVLAHRSEDTALEWEDRLQSLRHPMGHAEVSRRGKKVQTLTLPKQMKGQWVRRGDQQGLEIQLVARTRQELEKQAQRLIEISKVQGDSSPWT